MMAWHTRPRTQGDIRRWLQASGSLSARLAATGHFTVQVLTQGRCPLTPDEAMALGQPGRRLGYGREVVLRVDGVPLVYARSVTDHQASLGAWRAVRGLGSRPLADVLFKQGGIVRQPLQFLAVQRKGALHGRVQKGWLAATGQSPQHHALPARRSVFVRQHAALLVMEVFAASPSEWARPVKKAPIRVGSAR